MIRAFFSSLEHRKTRKYHSILGIRPLCCVSLFILTGLGGIPFGPIPQANGQFEFYRGSRSAAMGGTRAAVANDETSLLANPNGLRRVRGRTFHILNGEVAGNIPGLALGVRRSLLNDLSLQGLYEAQGSEPLEQVAYTKAQWFPSFVMRNFGVGFLGNFEALTLREASGVYQLNVKKDRALVVAGNTSFFGGVFKLGGSLRMIQRREFNGQRNPSVESLNLEEFGQRGRGVAFDTGVTLSLPLVLLPSLAVVWRDVGTTSFSSDGIGPRDVSSTLDAGFSIFPIFHHGVFGAFSVEVPDLLQAVDRRRLEEKIRVGLEINRRDRLFLRLGYGNQTWTAGAEWAFRYFQLQLATYREPVELAGRTNQEDRRWMLKLGFRVP